VLAAATAGAFVLPAPTAADDAAPKTTYDDHVRPVFESKCFSCHNPDKAKGGLDLTTYGAAMAGSSSGEIAVAGDPGGSTLYSVITHSAEPFMPPKGEKLDDASIETVARWLSGGLLESATSKAREAKKSPLAMALDGAPGKPDGPPPMPGDGLPLEPVVATAAANVVADLATSPWAPVVAATGQKQVLLYHAETLELLGVLAYPEGFPQSLAFSRSGKLLVAGGGRHGKSGNVVAWDIATGERALEAGAEFDAVLAADLNPSQTRLALGSTGKKVKLIDLATGDVTKTIDKHTEWITAVAFSPDGTYLATADRNGGLFVWEAETGNEIHTLEGHPNGITDLAWRADSAVLATASDKDGQVRLWDAKSGQKAKEWGAHGGGTLSVQFSPQGDLVTAGRDGRAKLWKPDGSHIRDLEPGGDLVHRACFNHDGTVAYAADWNGNITAFNTADGAKRVATATNPPPIATRIEQLLARQAEHQDTADTAARELASATAGLDGLADQVARLEQQLAELKNQLGTATAARDAATANLAKANENLDALAAEIERWRAAAARTAAPTAQAAP
jgi:mono/diheme cytochrome c family protein